MRIRLTLTVSDEQRRAIRKHTGQPGLATRDDVRRELQAVWGAHLEDVCFEAETGRNVEYKEGR